MREIFSRFNLKTVDINYTVGGSTTAKTSQEIIIKNW